MDKMTKIEIEGYKSIKNLKLDLGSINVLIGANGSGKSNFISFFKMLNYMTGEGLQIFINRVGGANSLLFYGAKETPQTMATLTFKTNTGISTYKIRLSDAAPDILIFVEEKVSFCKHESSRPQEIFTGTGHKETLLHEKASNNQTVAVMRNILSRIQFFQFHDTSENSRQRKSCPINQNEYLMKDAGNLAAYLYMLRNRYKENYKSIVSAIRLTAPYFGDFELEPEKLNPNYILLNWKEEGGDYMFGPHQLPDGLLRFMALATLLLQPKNYIPQLLIIDEPELGLHPHAINLLGALIREVSLNSQIIIATQSPILLNQFNPEEIIVVDRVENKRFQQFESSFNRPNADNLQEWLTDYTLGEIWQKNIIGGRPGR